MQCIFEPSSDQDVKEEGRIIVEAYRGLDNTYWQSHQACQNSSWGQAPYFSIHGSGFYGGVVRFRRRDGLIDQETPLVKAIYFKKVCRGERHDFMLACFRIKSINQVNQLVPTAFDGGGWLRFVSFTTVGPCVVATTLLVEQSIFSRTEESVQCFGSQATGGYLLRNG
jgi:hypothetical protein